MLIPDFSARAPDPADTPLAVVAFELDHDVYDLVGGVQDVLAGQLSACLTALDQ
jgi:hypothetical protein